MDQTLTVLGYHGTSEESATAILEPGEKNAERFLFSEKDTDWLGRGVYFFQDAPFRAREWPKVRISPPVRTENPVVLCAEIDLNDCLDLIDIEAAEIIARRYVVLEERYQKAGKSLPLNKGGKHDFDCVLINSVVDQLEAEGRRVSAVRATFIEGKPIVPGSQLYSHAHVQIVVRPYRTEVIKSIQLYHFEGGKQ
ncbi:MAG TPA: hypothetical protein VHZ04_01025 [Candidatus Paceibacterota bacterium]|jgi:hypothetical protein|nr:hypothetical protein [Candidatus Paceibacterota bacterium]